MRLADPWVLLVLLPLAWFYLRSKKRQVESRVYTGKSIPLEMQSGFVPLVLEVLRVIAVILLVVAAARPQSSSRETERQTSGIDILMIMDVSASMNIEDLGEKPRLDIAKRTMEDFIRGRDNDRIGFVVFSGEPLTLSPPTLDYGLVLQELRKVETGVLKDGTAIGDGLALGVNRLRNSTAKSRVIILLTDGDSNIGQVDPLTAGDLAAGFGIKVYTIAIGREGRVKLPIRRKTFTGDVVTNYQWFDNALNTELLQQISGATNGKFYRVQDEKTLDEVFSEINRLEKSDLKVKEKIRYDERFQLVAMLALGFLLLEVLFSRFVWRVVA